MKSFLQKIRYPKFILLFFVFFFVYVVFTRIDVTQFQNKLLDFGYIGAFIAGIGFVYGFTAAPATAVLLMLGSGQNLLLLGCVAGFGALLGDFIIFRFIKSSFADEIEKISQEKIVRFLNQKTPLVLKKYFIPVIGCVFIASPLPDEIGVSLLAISRSMSQKIFALVSYILNTAGIFTILFIGRAI